MKMFSSLFLCISVVASAQFDPAGGIAGSRSIHRDHQSIESWADSVVFNPGWIQIDDTVQGKVQSVPSNCTGEANGSVTSLGDSGYATYYFSEALRNREGFDFAVFENGFQSGAYYYLELAFVEVSVDGVHFVRFNNHSRADTLNQLDFGGTVLPEWYHNLAGKHQAPYGTLFDLNELGLDSIHYIRILDVIGTLDPQYGSRDSSGWLINDPWPTPWASSGFDLDALAIVNTESIGINYPGFSEIAVYPNVLQAGDIINLSENIHFAVYNMSGGIVTEGFGSALSVNEAGMYLIRIEKQGKWHTGRLIIY